MSAWPKEKREIIEFVEDGTALLLELRGYLQAKGERPAAEYAGKIDLFLDTCRKLRTRMYVQLGFWDEPEKKGPKKRGKD